MDKPRRGASSKAATLKNAIQQLAAVRSGKTTRIDQYEVEEEEPIYDEVDEDNYKKLVAGRRSDADFVVDDNGLGYADDGEEDYSDVSDDETRAINKRIRAEEEAADVRQKKKRSGFVEQSTKITSLFLKPAAVVGPATEAAKPAAAAAPDVADDFLEGLLGDLDKPGASSLRPMTGARMGMGQPSRAPLPPQAGPRRALFDEAGMPTGETADESTHYDDGGFDDYGGHDDVHAEPAEHTAAGVVAAPPLPAPVAPVVVGQAADRSKWKVTPKERVQQMLNPVATGGAGSDAPGSLFDPMDLVASLGDLGAMPADSAEATVPKELGSLPLTPEGSLLMFWLDAYEDPVNMPGVLYLFGKVLVKQPATFASCCVGINGLDRHVFLLPRETNLETGEPVTAMALLSELKETMIRVVPPGKGQYRTRKVTKNYAFEMPNVPREETTYIELVYGFKFPPLPTDFSGKTFSRVFGARTSALETVLLHQDIMGPCWLEIKNVKPVTMPLSFCVHEVTVDSPSFVAPLPSTARAPPSPPVSVASLSLKTVVNPKTHGHEIVVASIVYHSSVNIDGPTTTRPGQLMHVTAVAASSHSGISSLPLDLKDVLAGRGQAAALTTIKPMQNERALLCFLVSRLSELDPDVILGHNITGFELDVLLHRIAHHAVPNWSSIGRLRRKQLPRIASGSSGQETFVGVLAAGRLVCDTFLSSRELLRETTYTLTNLAKTQLSVDRREVDPLEVPRFFTSSGSVIALCQHTEKDAALAMQLMFKLQVLPLTKQLTNLAGNLWSRSLRGARAERIEYLLLHTFHRAGYIVPDKEFTPQTKTASGKNEAPNRMKTKKKPAYSGGLVLEPKRGLYDKFVLLLDFNSLYPSIIQEFNICFTTVERPATGHLVAAPKAAEQHAGDEEEEMLEDESDDPIVNFVPSLPDPMKYTTPGILPRVIRTLVEKRREVKKLLKTEKDALTKQQLDIRQMALKILANSMYGCLGFSSSRFYAKPLAALVTSQGRDILQNTVSLARSTLNLDVIYGDTDSIMIHTNTDNLDIVRKMGEEVKAAVNKLYKLLEIEVDGIFKTMLLLKKKKYAALVVSELPGGAVTYNREMKGLDIVRRDWCVVSKELGSQVLDLILSGKDKEDVVDAIHALLTEFATEARAGRVPLDKYVITKGLNKSPKDYPDAKSQPHLQVALRMLTAGKPVNVGDHIPYVICLEPSTAAQAGGSPGQADVTSSHTSVATRAFHPDEVRKSGGALKPDVEWYLVQQVLPPISRLCEPIRETSQARLAECLGIDSSRFRTQTRYDGDADADGALPKRMLDPSERFKHARPLPVICQRCSFVSTLPKVFSSAPTPGEDPTLKSHSGLQCSQPGCGGMWRSGVGLSSAIVAGGSDAAKLVPMPIPPAKAGAVPLRHELEFCRASLMNGLISTVRSQLAEYSQHWMRCDDNVCGIRTRQQPVARQGKACTRPGCRGVLQPELSDGDLHTQLEYFQSLFERPSGPVSDYLAPHAAVTADLRRVAADFVTQNAYHVVDADAVFGYADSLRPP